MRRSTGWPAVAFIALLAPPSCGGSGAPFVGTISRSKFFEYHDEVDEPLCPTLLSMLDQHAEQIGGKIGFRPDPANLIAYYKFRDVVELEGSSICPETAGCAGHDTVYSAQFLQAHELAHTYTFRAWGGHPTGLVAEGEAVALSCDPGAGVQPGYRPRDMLGDHDWRDFLYLFGNSVEGYQAAGYWITYLADHYGWDSVRQLHQRAVPGISPADFEREFARVYPISMDEAWSAALDTPDTRPCQDDWRCLATPLAVGESAPPACDGEMHRAIAVGDQGGIALALSRSFGDVTLRDCENPASPRYRLDGGPTDPATHFATLPPGTYTLFAGYGLTNLALAGYLPMDFNRDACTTAGGITLDHTQASTIDLLPGKTNGWIPIEGGGDSFLVEPYSLGWPGWPAADGGPAICDGCGPTAICVPLPGGEQTLVAIGDGAVLRLLGVSTVQSPVFFGQVSFWPAARAGQGP